MSAMSFKSATLSFYVLGIFASAFSSSLLYGFAQMEGLGSEQSWMGLHYDHTKADDDAPSAVRPGLVSWRWIFIWQGIIAVIIATLGYVYMVEFPDMTLKHRYLIRFLEKREVDYMIA
jgi:hypothetical protein